MTSDNSTRTVVLGFDALDFRYLDSFDASLPNLSALRESGVEAPLDSTFPPWTGSAWPSMYTGTDPGHHGVFSFFDYEDSDPDSAQLVSRSDVEQPALWDYLTAEGVPSIVLNVPVTHPADPIEGVLIPGYLAPEDADGYPSDVRAELEEELGRPYRIYSRAESSDDKAEKLAGYLDLIELRGEAATYLLSEYEWEVAVIQVQKTDAVFHNFDDTAAFRQVYERADALVGDVQAAVDDDTNIVVCSDHGMGPTDGYGIYVNDVLAKHGIVEPSSESSHRSLATEKSTLTAQTVDHTETEHSPLVTTLSKVASTLPVAPGRVYNTAERVGLGPTLRRLVPREVVSSAKRGVDWQSSQAYCRLGSELGVRINLAGRDPHGVVSQSEYEPLRGRIIDVLSSLETPDGDPAFEYVVRREEVYTGPAAEEACDVLFMPTEMNHTIGTTIIDTPFVPYEAYDHKRAGVFVGNGPAFEADASLDHLDLTDIAPIVLSLAGRPVPERMTGTVPPGLLTQPVETRAYTGLSYGDHTEDDADEAVRRDNLRDLGYL
jgi:predicted AlkP superfamily phosphohydrolase/phosphomutase